jgi:hypothetical protein
MPWSYKHGWSWAWHTYMLINDSFDFGAFYGAKNFAPRLISRVNIAWFPNRKTIRKPKHVFIEEERDRATVLVEAFNQGLLSELFPTINLPAILKSPIIAPDEQEENES